VRHHLTLELTDSASALIRVVSCVHSRGLQVEHLHLNGRQGCICVAGEVPLHRIVASFDRLVDVLVVEPSPSCEQQATRARAVRTVPARRLATQLPAVRR
jgi:acetolactate synthase regulatory subunit